MTVALSLLAGAVLASVAGGKPATRLTCKVVAEDMEPYSLDLTIKPHESAGNVWTIAGDFPRLPKVSGARDVRLISKEEQKHDKLPSTVPYREGSQFEFVNEIAIERGPNSDRYRIEIAGQPTGYPYQPIVAVEVSLNRTYLVGPIVENEQSYIGSGLCRRIQGSEGVR